MNENINHLFDLKYRNFEKATKVIGIRNKISRLLTFLNDWYFQDPSCSFSQEDGGQVVWRGIGLQTTREKYKI